MQKRLLTLMRHAKSDWNSAAKSDRDRPLNDRGRRDCPAMARYLIHQGHVPGLILCSSAKRTSQTAERMFDVWEAGGVDRPEIIHREDLYLASPRTIVDLIAKLGDTTESLMVIAHNPGMSSLASTICQQDLPMPTAAVATACYESNDWSTFQIQSDVEMVNFMRPKMLPENFRREFRQGGGESS